MESSLVRIGIVGASSLLGKELADVLGSSSFAAGDVVLLDQEEVTGQIASVGDEAAFIHRIEAASFEGLDIVFFAGKPDETRKHWMAARKAGASVIDLTGALTGEAGVVVRSPWVLPAKPDLAVTAVMPAHPVAVMLGMLAHQCAGLGLSGVAATVLLPASERGQEGMDEMHRQTVNLLSFQSLPREEFGAQVAFNLLPALGDAAKTTLEQTANRILSDYAASGTLPELALQVVQAPVFHGYAISMLLEGTRLMTADEIEYTATGEHIDVVSAASDPPSNLSAAGQDDVLVRVSQDRGRRMWVWMTADNLRLTALHAIACAVELQAPRPRGKVQ